MISAPKCYGVNQERCLVTVSWNCPFQTPLVTWRGRGEGGRGRGAVWGKTGAGWGTDGAGRGPEESVPNFLIPGDYIKGIHCHDTNDWILKRRTCNQARPSPLELGMSSLGLLPNFELRIFGTDVKGKNELTKKNFCFTIGTSM